MDIPTVGLVDGMVVEDDSSEGSEAENGMEIEDVVADPTNDIAEEVHIKEKCLSDPALKPWPLDGTKEKKHANVVHMIDKSPTDPTMFLDGTTKLGHFHNSKNKANLHVQDTIMHDDATHMIENSLMDPTMLGHLQSSNGIKNKGIHAYNNKDAVQLNKNSHHMQGHATMNKII
ncbi:hypothetical protein L2E82_13080 [Cichorium intybus]|uniref:Uncharacterized protein n=1 Tax=Cichorium intybus TaxID=13427 RepID=A0ACB9GIY2_CICIN|nr:hypothetical protein L2E82_13080 [Cichorium intybus]